MLKTHERIAVLDDFKGFMLFFYIFVQVMTLPKTFATPEWFAHSKIGGQALPFLSISISDFGPALFFFVIGMAAVCAFENRVKRDGLKAARRHYLYRNLAVVGIAAAAQFAGNALSGSSYDWNALSSVGFVGVLMYPFLRKGTWFRLSSACVLLAWYQLFRSELFALLGGNEGGIAACFGYLGLTLLASVLSDLLKKELMLYGAGVQRVVCSDVFVCDFVAVLRLCGSQFLCEKEHTLRQLGGKKFVVLFCTHLREHFLVKTANQSASDACRLHNTFLHYFHGLLLYCRRA